MAGKDQKRQQMEYLAVGFFVLVAVVIGFTRFKKGERKDEVLSKEEFNKRWAEVEILEAKVPEEEEGITYLTYSDRVPFKSPFEEEGVALKDDEGITLPTMSFQGMVWSSLRPQAIIDNKVYDIGDVIEIGTGETKVQVYLKDITRSGIHLRYKGKVFIVRPK